MPIDLGLLSDAIIARGVAPADVSKLPDAYFYGLEQAQKQAALNAFSSGLPKIPGTNDVDWRATMEKIAQVGGVPAINNILALRQADIQQQGLNALQGAGPQIFTSPTAPAPAQPPSPAPPSVQRTSGNVVEPPSGEPLRPGQQGNLGEVTGVSVDGQPTTSFANRFAGEPAQDSRYPPQFAQVAEEKPIQVAQNAQGQPPPPPPPPPQQSPVYDQRDPRFFTVENLQAHQAVANRANWAAAVAEMSGLKGDAGMLAQGKQSSDMAKAIAETLGKNVELPPEVKTYQATRNPGESFADYKARIDATTKAKELELTRGDKLYGGLAAGSINYNQEDKPLNDLARAVLNDPNMWTGAVGERSLDFNKIRSAFGEGRAAQLQEMLQKVTAQGVLSSINNQKIQASEAGQAAGRIFQSMISQIEKSVPTLGTTLQGNRSLIEIKTRLGEYGDKIFEFANNYLQDPKHPYLDRNFDVELARWMKRNPAFSEQERSYPLLLGAPSVPPAIANNPASIVQWGRQMGINSGDAIRFPDGSIQGFSLTPKIQ